MKKKMIISKKKEVKNDMIGWDSGISCPSVEDLECALMKIGSPEIHFSRNAFDKIRFLVRKYPDLEWLAAMVGEKYEEHKYVVTDLQVVEQEVTSHHCDVTDVGRREIGKIRNVIGWIHSHNTMKAYQSGTDVDTSHNYPASITVNNALEFAGVIKEKIGCPHANVEEVFRKAEIYIPVDSLEFPELDAVCDEKISEKKWGQRVAYYDNTYESNWDAFGKQQKLPLPDDFDEDFCIICYQKVSEKKRIECVSCGSTMHKRCARKNGVCPSCEASFVDLDELFDGIQ